MNFKGYSISIGNYQKNSINMIVTVIAMVMPSMIYFLISDLNDWWIFILPIMGALLSGLFYYPDLNTKVVGK